MLGATTTAPVAGATDLPRQAAPRRRKAGSGGDGAASELVDMRAVVEQAPLRIMLLDRDLVIRYVNQASAQGLHDLAAYLPVMPEAVVGSRIDVLGRPATHQQQILGDPSNLPVTARLHVGPETLDVTVTPLFGDTGDYIGAMATWDNVTAALSASADADIDNRALSELMRGLATAASSDQTIKIALDTIRGVFGWAYGSYWKLDETGEHLKFCAETGAATEEFARVTRTATFARGVGLSGRTWQSGDLMFVADIGEMTDCVRARPHNGPV